MTYFSQKSLQATGNTSQPNSWALSICKCSYAAYNTIKTFYPSTSHRLQAASNFIPEVSPEGALKGWAQKQHLKKEHTQSWVNQLFQGALGIAQQLFYNSSQELRWLQPQCPRPEWPAAHHPPAAHEALLPAAPLIWNSHSQTLCIAWQSGDGRLGWICWQGWHRMVGFWADLSLLDWTEWAGDYLQGSWNAGAKDLQTNKVMLLYLPQVLFHWTLYLWIEATA